MPMSAKSIYKRISSTFSAPKRQEPPPPPPSATFLCPISSLLMFDPVVVPSGYSFDCACIQACRDLNFTPPHIHLNLHLDFPLIPNVIVREAILDWCNLSGNPPPTPISQDSARYFIRGLSSFLPTLLPFSSQPLPYFPFDSVQEKWFLKTLNKPKQSSKESAFTAYIEAPLCSPRILAAIILYLTDDDFQLKTRAAEAIHALSCKPFSRHHILLSGAVPAIITVLNSGMGSASVEAAGALHNLSTNRLARLLLGAFGAVPALMNKFCQHNFGCKGRKDAAFALYTLSSCPRNLEVLVENNGVERLLAVADDRLLSPRETRRYALILLHCMVGLRRGREEVMNGGRIEVLLGMVEDLEGVGVCSLALMYKVCRLNLRRFRVAGRSAGVEGVLTEELEEWGEISKEMEQWGEIGKEMARGLVRVMRGECNEGNQLMKIGIDIAHGVPVEIGGHVEEEEGEA